VLRALALCAMIAYHFAFDLRYYGVIRTDFEHDPVCLAVRSAILSSFLLLAGIGLALEARSGAPPARFWRRVGEIGACALLVSAGSFAMFPQSYIWFGVLHAITVTLVLARPLAGKPRVAGALGLVVIAAGLLFSHPAFDNRALGWIGFMTAKPITEDYVPLFPWAGALLLGIPLGHALAAANFRPLAALAAFPRAFAFAGRHTLVVYMIHQPILLGLLALLLRR